MRTRDLIAHEWKIRLSRPAAVASLMLFAMTLVYGAFSGGVQLDTRQRAIAGHETEVATLMTKWRADLLALEENNTQAGVPPWAGSPMDAMFASSLPPAPLADYAIGQADLLPYYGTLSLWDPDTRTFSRYELADPVALALGSLDLSKAVLLMLPLLLIVLTFDVLSSERDAGRLALTMVQAASIQSLFWRRLLIRSAAALLLVLILSLAAAAARAASPSTAERLLHYLLWLLAASCYAGFWIALISFIAGRNRSGASNVMLLLLAWAGLTLVVPAGVGAVVEMIYPTPSRLAYLEQSRAIEIETELAEPQIAQQLVLDHPELFAAQASAIPAYVRSAFLVTSRVDKATSKVLTAFEDAASRRERALSVLGFTSPTVIVHGLFNEIAGTSAARQRRYTMQARAFKREYAKQAAGHILMGQRLPVREAAGLARFQFVDEPLAARLRLHATALLALMAATGLLLILAQRRLRHAGMRED
jgi:ABC-2 type transport system permease protein